MSWNVQRQRRGAKHYYSAVFTYPGKTGAKQSRSVTLGFLAGAPEPAPLTERLKQGDPHGLWKDAAVAAVVLASSDEEAMRAATVAPLFEPRAYSRVAADPRMEEQMRAYAALTSGVARSHSMLSTGLDVWTPRWPAASSGAGTAPAAEALPRRRVEPIHPNGTMTLRDYVADVWEAEREKQSAATWKREFWWWDRRILPTLGGLRLCDLDTERWSAFLAGLPATVKGRSKGLAQTAYRCAMRHAEKLKWIEHVHQFLPIPGATKKSLTDAEPLTLGEVERFLDAAPSAMHRAMFAVQFGMGMRPGEALRVMWADVNWAKNPPQIAIRGTKNVLATATVSMTKPAARELRAWWEAQGKPSEGYAFEKQRGAGPFAEFPRTAFHSAAKRSGLNAERTRHLFPYIARHSFATNAAAAGIDRAFTKKMMRHSQESTVLETAYEKFSIQQTADAFAGFGEEKAGK